MNNVYLSLIPVRRKMGYIQRSLARTKYAVFSSKTFTLGNSNTGIVCAALNNNVFFFLIQYY